MILLPSCLFLIFFCLLFQHKVAECYSDSGLWDHMECCIDSILLTLAYEIKLEFTGFIFFFLK